MRPPADVPVCSLPLVQRRRAPGAVLLPVLAAQPGGAGHVVVGHRGRLHGLQGLEVCVASAAAQVEETRAGCVQRSGVNHSFSLLSWIHTWN